MNPPKLRHLYAAWLLFSLNLVCCVAFSLTARATEMSSETIGRVEFIETQAIEAADGTVFEVAYNRLILSFNAEVLPNQIQEYVSSLRVAGLIENALPDGHTFVLRSVEPKSYQELVEVVRNQELITPEVIAFIEPDYVYSFADWDDYVPTNRFSVRVGAPGTDYIGASDLWVDRPTDSMLGYVAVLDYGVDYTHHDLAGLIWMAPHSNLEGPWPSEYSAARDTFSIDIGSGAGPVVCPIGAHGFDFVSGGVGCDGMDEAGHGTMAAGVVAAVGGFEHIGILPMRVLDNSGKTTSEILFNAVNAIIDLRKSYAGLPEGRINVINVSWGAAQLDAEAKAYDRGVRNAIAWAAQNDILFVAGAGNNGWDNDGLFPFFPASYGLPNIISVTASTDNDEWAGRSYGKASVHLAAPGVMIATTLLGGAYGDASGTSIAAPFVAGSAALLMGICPPSYFEEYRYLYQAAVDAIMSGLTFSDNLAEYTLGAGRLDLLAAYNYCAR